jgi:hypothetical protein
MLIIGRKINKKFPSRKTVEPQVLFMKFTLGQKLLTGLERNSYKFLSFIAILEFRKKNVTFLSDIYNIRVSIVLN